MTKRESIRECKKLWKDTEKSGLAKEDFLKTPDSKVWRDKGYESDCPLCEYVGEDGCDKCPLVKQYGADCYDLGFSEIVTTPEWMAAVKGLKE